MQDVHVLVKGALIDGQGQCYKAWLYGVEGDVLIELASVWEPSFSILEALDLLNIAVGSWKEYDYPKHLSGVGTSPQ